ncbi:hypothetical protein ACFQLX_15305 [Streptomyces polyrhachis]|uniref:Integral membrane protein n=1 Tax=Streptomyces polyrhachis TaxID=1282885 RepID=A0ABW2GJ11_9ACTN
MSQGDDYGNHDAAYGGGRQTRTRLPEGDAGRGPVRGGGTGPGRGVVAIVGVVVLLIAAIAFANQDRDDSGPRTDTPGKGNATAPSGERPVTGSTGGIPSGFPKTEQGAQSAAANYAVALGGTGMFNAPTRHSIVDALYTPDAAAQLKSAQDKAYSAAFLQRMGLDSSGKPPSGKTFISRTVPIGTKTLEFNGDKAKVSVWYTGLIGMAGRGSTDPVRTNWMTWTFDLRYVGSDWKIVDDNQQEGPAPVPGDVPAATDTEISGAVEEFGGFTYAR